METSETTIIDKIIEKFESALPEEFSLKADDKWIISKGYVSFDFAIYYNRRLYAVVELKTNISSFQEKIKQYVRDVECRFGILTNGDEYYLYDSINGEGEKLDVEQIVKKLDSSIQDTAKAKTSQAVDKRIRELFINNNLEEFIDGIVQDFLAKWRFEDLDTEQKFFEKILNGNKSITEFCRYTSLDSLIRMLNDGTYQMCGIVGMNDKSEVYYFNKKYLPKKQNSMSFDDCNKIYLSSGTSLKDNLTMWRLYGDDGKGVCLVFEVKPSIDFYIAKVDYEKEDKSHENVKLIKVLIGKGFKFEGLNVWKHFFKPHDYSVEKEIRLMFYEHSDSSSTDDKDKNKKEWIKANGSSIVIPVKRFDMLEEFPLTLKAIILGPKINEPDLNKVQIESMVKKGVTVEHSSIENYR